jgi:hypothetical protein
MAKNTGEEDVEKHVSTYEGGNNIIRLVKEGEINETCGIHWTEE